MPFTKANMSVLADRIFEECRNLLAAGQMEYAQGDENALDNFERQAKALGLSREHVLLVYLNKHMDGISSWARGHQSQREDVTGRINDAITYLCLLRGMIEDSRAIPPGSFVPVPSGVVYDGNGNPVTIKRRNDK